MVEVTVPVSDIIVDVQVYCGTCSAAMCENSTAETTRNNWGQPEQTTLQVEVCQKCQQTAKDEGINEGYLKGYEEAENEKCNADHDEEGPDKTR